MGEFIGIVGGGRDIALAGRVWFNNFRIITSIYYARINRGFRRRAGYFYVFFLIIPISLYSLKFVENGLLREVLLLFKHIFRNRTVPTFWPLFG